MSSSRDRSNAPAQTISEPPAFRVRIGTGRAEARPKLKSFIGRIKAMVREQGGAGRARCSRGGKGGAAAARIPVRASPQRVAVKTRVIRHSKYRSKGGPSAAIADEVQYLTRRSASEDGELGVAFDADGSLSREELKQFRERMVPDRHHFRMVVSPENGVDLDLPTFSRELVAEMQKDLSTRLKWFGVAHYDTDNPHVHLIVRGKDDRNQDLVISRDYISHGMRLQAGEVATRRLGPRRAEDIAIALKRDLTAERVTPLDRIIDAQRATHPEGLVSAIRGRNGDLAREHERVRLLSRLQYLESLQLAREVAPGVWQPDANLLPRLKALSLRGDIVKTLHAQSSGKPWRLDPIVLDREHPPREPIIGRVVHRARVDEFWDDEYLLVDGHQGRNFYVPMAGALRRGENPNIGAIVRLKGAAGQGDRGRLEVAALAPDLQSQVNLDGVTFLDRDLIEDGMPREARAGIQGFEADYQQALRRRLGYLQRLGLLEGEGEQRRVPPSLLDHLYERELEAVRPQLAARFGEFKSLQEGMSFRGTLRSIEALPSGPHAVIAEAGRYTLVPAAAALQHSLGRSVRLTLGAPNALPTLAPRALRLSIEFQFLSRRRGIGGSP